MKRGRKPFSVFLKTLANGAQVYYLSTYDTDGRRRQFSTHTRNLGEAHRVAMKRFQEGRLVPTDRLQFRVWTQNWFVYETCPYIRSRLERGFSYSHVHAANQRSLMVRFLWPILGDKALDSIRALEIEALVSQMLKTGHSRDLANRCLKVLGLVLGEAVRLGLIDKNPTNQVRFRKHTSREKGILTEDESRRLFDPETWSLIWRGKKEAYLASLLGYQGGLRQGEQIGLQVEDLRPYGLLVHHGWDRMGGLKGTKNGGERFVPLPEGTLSMLRRLANEGHVFRLNGKMKPVSASYLRKALIEALQNIGISREDQVRRNLGSHSLRHGLVSNLLAHGTPAAVVAQLVGHKSLALTTKTYHHATPLHSRLVVEIQERLFPEAPRRPAVAEQRSAKTARN